MVTFKFHKISIIVISCSINPNSYGCLVDLKKYSGYVSSMSTFLSIENILKKSPNKTSISANAKIILLLLQSMKKKEPAKNRFTISLRYFSPK